MEFKEATDRLMQRVTNQDVADACGVSRNLIERARMDGEHARAAPPSWEPAIAQLARQRAHALLEFAEELDPTGKGRKR